MALWNRFIIWYLRKGYTGLALLDGDVKGSNRGIIRGYFAGFIDRTECSCCRLPSFIDRFNFTYRQLLSDSLRLTSRRVTRDGNFSFLSFCIFARGRGRDLSAVKAYAGK